MSPWLLCFPLLCAGLPPGDAPQEKLPLFEYHLSWREPAALEVEILLPRELPEHSLRMLWPDWLPIDEISITPAREAQRTHLARGPIGRRHLDLAHPRGARIRYIVRSSSDSPPANRETCLLIGSDLLLVIGRFPLGLPDIESDACARLVFDVAPLSARRAAPFDDPAERLGAGGAVPLGALEEVLLAAGSWEQGDLDSAPPAAGGSPRRWLAPPPGTAIGPLLPPLEATRLSAARKSAADLLPILDGFLGKTPGEPLTLVFVPALPPPEHLPDGVFCAALDARARPHRFLLIPWEAAGRESALAERLVRARPLLGQLDASGDPVLADALARWLALRCTAARRGDQTFLPAALREIFLFRPPRTAAQHLAAEVVAAEVLDQELWSAGPRGGDLIALLAELAGSGVRMDRKILEERVLARGGARVLRAWRAAAACAPPPSPRGLGAAWSVAPGGHLELPAGLYRISARDPAAALPLAGADLDAAQRACLETILDRLRLELRWPLSLRSGGLPVLGPAALRRGRNGSARLFLRLGEETFDTGSLIIRHHLAGEKVHPIHPGAPLAVTSDPDGGRHLVQKLSYRYADLLLRVDFHYRGVDSPPRRTASPRLGRLAAGRDGRSPTLDLELRGAPLPRRLGGAAPGAWRWTWLSALGSAPRASGCKRRDASWQSGWFDPEMALPTSLDRSEEGDPGARYSGPPLRGREAWGFQVLAEQRWQPARYRTAGFDQAAFPAEAEIHRQLLARFLAGLRYPLPRVEGMHPLIGADDLPFRAGLDPDHDALDIGARLVEEASGRIRHYPVGTPVRAVHIAQRRLEVADGRLGFEVVVSSGLYRLRVRLGYVHVRPASPPRESAPGAESPVGELEPLDPSIPWGGWRTTDPALYARGVPKGNHLHLTLAGIYESGSPRERLNHRKTRFICDRLLPALAAAWSRAPAATIATVAAPIASAARPPVRPGALGFHALVEGVEGVERLSFLAAAGYRPAIHPPEAAILRRALAELEQRARPPLASVEVASLEADRRGGVVVHLAPEPGASAPRAVASIWPGGSWKRIAGDALEQELEIHCQGYLLRIAVVYRGLRALPGQPSSRGSIGALAAGSALELRFPDALCSGGEGDDSLERRWIAARLLPVLSGRRD